LRRVLLKEALWKPPEERKKNANVTRFIAFVNRKHGKEFKAYPELYQWSVDHIPDFWAAMWEFADIRASKKYQKVIDDLNQFPGAKCQPGSPGLF
jgi:acetoacetyl-CoA synthetase